VVFLVLAVSILLLAGCQKQGRAETGSARDLAGQSVNPLADDQAKAVVLLFVSTECPIANRYAPETERLAAEFRPQGVRFWRVYPNRDESAEAIRRHSTDYGYTMDALRDTEHWLVRKTGARTTPEAAVFTPGARLAYLGRIDDLYVALGVQRKVATEHNLREALVAILAGKRVPRAAVPAVGCSIPDP
jgi:hypothetical protein